MMPTYVYRCDAGRGCGEFERRYPIAEVPAVLNCPECADSARRVITAPALGVGDSPAMRLHDATAATADRPAVVSAVPGSARAARRPVTTDPRHRKLPRP